MAKGLSGSVDMVNEIGLYSGFKVDVSGLVESHLKYIDDILLVDVLTLENLSIKAVVRRFDQASKLRVNFFKSSLIGVNVDPLFPYSAEESLHYEIETLLFKYLVLLMGKNPRLESTLDPLVNLLNKRLHSCKHKYVNLGGRVILLNSMLNVIPVFFFSFSKIPIKVWKKLVYLQRRFL